MKRFLSKIPAICYYIAFSLILALLCYLTIAALKQTAMMDYNMSEYTYFINDNWLINLIISLFFGYLIYFIAKILSRFRLRYIYISFMLIISVYMIYLINNINLYPSWDALFVNQAAYDLKNGIYDAFMPGNYLATYPFLIPTVLYYYLLNLLFGTNYIVFQLVNLVMLIIMYHFIAKTTLIMKNKHSAIIVLILCGCFVPLQMYIMFLYSNIPSALFSAIAIYNFTKYFVSKSQNNLIFGFISLTLAILFKGTSYVILIAFWIIFLFIQNNHFSLQKFAIALISTVLLLSTPHFISSGIESNDNRIELSTTLYSKVAMVMGSTWGGRCAGWYSGYGQTLIDKYGDDEIAKTQEARKQLIINYTTLWKNHDLLSFFDTKSKSMWINPDFQGLWTINANKEVNRGLGEHDKQSFLFIQYDQNSDWYSKITQSFFYGNIHKILAFMLNILQNIIYIFSLIYLISRYRKPDFSNLFTPLILLGGFLFLSIWEGKAQYSILYYIQLFPIAAIGLYESYFMLENHLKKKKLKNQV